MPPDTLPPVLISLPDTISAPPAAVPPAATSSPRELARRLGCNQSHVSRWLSGAVMPRASVIEELAHHMGKTEEELLLEIYRKRKNKKIS
jgi:transcriptional regulator with XRE-family HTH domain